MWFMFQHLVKWCSAASYFKDALILQGFIKCKIRLQYFCTVFPLFFLRIFFVLFPGEKKNLMSWANNTFPNLRTDVYCKPFWCCYMIDCRFLQCQRFWILTSKMFFMASIFGGMQHWSVATYLKWAMCFVSKHPYANNNERK